MLNWTSTNATGAQRRQMEFTEGRGRTADKIQDILLVMVGVPVVPATWEAEAGRPLYPRSLRRAWAVF
jgi:hypothetical protein